MAAKDLSEMSILKGTSVQNPMNLSKLISSVLDDDKLSKKTALILKESIITFQQLSQMVEKICNKIQAAFQVSSCDIICISLPPSFERIAAILACLKLGKSYMPIDENTPHERVKFMINESQAKVLLTYSNSSLTAFVEIVVIIVDNNMAEYSLPVDSKQPTIDDFIACVLYTSGSTGKPKGVRLKASNLMNRLQWYWQTFPFSPNEIGCHKTSITFVDSVTEILSSLLHGVPMLILSDEERSRVDLLVDAVYRYKVTRLVLVPSLLHSIIDYVEVSKEESKLSHLKVLISSGEALRKELALKILSTVETTLLNFYGSTETTGDLSYYAIKNKEDVHKGNFNGCVSLGNPISDSNVYICDEEMKLVPLGTSGEICVSGLNIADGYMGKCKSDKCNSFISNMFSDDENHKLLYRMGDIGRIQDGKVYFEGRKDSQVKIRGHRINLLEVEHALKKSDLIRACVVLCCPLNRMKSAPWEYSEKIIVAFVMINGNDIKQAEDDLMKICKESLASYMIPKIKILDQFPLQSHTGKIDRQALIQNYIDPEDPANDSKDAKWIIGNCLGMKSEEIDWTKTFYDLGGNSLSAVSVITQLKKNGFSKCTLSQFANATSLGVFISKIDNQSGTKTINCTKGETDKKFEKSDHMYSDFAVEELNEAHKDEVVEIMTKAFAYRNPLDVFAGSGEQLVRKGVLSLWDDAVKDKLSFVVKDNKNGSVVAASMNFDISTDIQPDFQEVVIAINEDVENPVKEQLIAEGGKWMDGFLMAVQEDYLPLSVDMVKLLENTAFEKIKQLGYTGVITVNSHPVTAVAVVTRATTSLKNRMIAEQDLGFTKENAIHVKSYEYKGRFPFSKVDDDYYIYCMIKRVMKTD